MGRILAVCAICVLFSIASQAQSAVCDLSAGPQSLIRAAAERDRANENKVRQYTWMQREENRRLNSDGSVKSTEVRILEYLKIYGEGFERLISVNGKPISDQERAKQDAKIDKLIRERENETPAQRQKRLDEAAKKDAENRAFIEEVADAFNLKMLPDEHIAGHTALVIAGEPKPGYKPHHKNAAILSKFRFRTWLNSSDCNWIKVDAQAIDTVSIGGIVARIGKGTRLVIEQTEVNDEVWLPRHLAVKIDGRLMLLKKLNMETDLTFSDYRRFRADSRISGVEELPPSSVPSAPRP